MIVELEKALLIHNDLLILLFTLALVISGLIAAISTYLNVRELKKQLSIQERIFLQSTLINLYKTKYDLENALLEYSSYTEEKKAELIDDNLDLVQKEIYDIKKRIDEASNTGPKEDKYGF